MVRIATLEDLDLVVSLGMSFIETTKYKDIASEDKIRELSKKLIETPNEYSIILLYEDFGMLAATVVPFMFGPSIYATEIAWWVSPEKRKSNVGSELLEAFEYWANKVGCEFVTMVSLDDQVSKIYEKQGYKLFERTYLKGLK